MNRVTMFVERLKETSEKLRADGSVSQAQLDDLEQKLKLPQAAHGGLLRVTRWAYQDRFLTSEEAATLYELIGDSPDHLNAQPFHVKMVVCSVLKWYTETGLYAIRALPQPNENN